MAQYSVELSFEYKVTYHIEADSPEAAVDVAIVKDQALPNDQRPPLQYVKGLLDTRVFDEAGREMDVEN